jgi:hypothetical protein
MAVSPPPTVNVIDLTARLGLYALRELGVTTSAESGCWRQIALGGVSVAPRLDWHRPAVVDELTAPAPDCAATILLVGPGSAPTLRAALALLAPLTDTPVWAFLMPNALVETTVFKALPPEQAARMLAYQLPDSSPQTFWFVLMEQLGKLSAMADLALQPSHNFSQDNNMSSNLKQCMDAAMTIDGAMAAALVDYRSGMCLAQAGGGLNLDLAAAGNTQVVNAKLKTMESLGLRRGIEDILITLADQYHLIRFVPNNQGLFLYLVLDKAKGNLALARYKLTDIERSLKV